VAYPEIFGGGDCISFEKKPLDKVGVYAVRQNPILYTNLLAALVRWRFASLSTAGYLPFDLEYLVILRKNII
jgi:NADH dehydrogenase FAD-containing subunit